MNKKITKQILKRLLSSIITIFLLLTFIFFLVRLSPGDPTQKYLSPELSPALAQKVSESFNLNDPVITQYFSFIKNLVQGDFGYSYNYRIPVWDVIWEYLPFTLIFASIVFLFQMLFSFLLAIFSIKHLNSFIDKLLTKISILLFVTPVFVVGLFLVLIFSVQLNLFPLPVYLHSIHQVTIFFKRYLIMQFTLHFPCLLYHWEVSLFSINI